MLRNFSFGLLKNSQFRSVLVRSFASESTASSAASATVGDECTLERLEGADKGISVITFNRSAVKNAIGANLLRQFKSHLSTVRFDQETRVVILRSSVSGVFCAGADLKERAQMSQKQASEFVYDLRNSFTELEVLPQPTIAVIDGVALGGGLEMALSCDFRFASTASKLGLPETGLAIIPGAGGTQRLPRLIGPAAAKELIFTGAVINSKRALEIGLIQRETEPSETFNKAVEFARTILPKGPIAIRVAKIAIDKGMNVDIATGMSIEQACYAQVIPTKDRTEGLTAFKEKRPPVYKGE
ncbi:enoyl-CoA hydratase/isomerase domain-containing protein [Heterostelium album PN500]|uniref:Enoyl-CoA hydratase/isomerase domain-containing protein n=1 Tax=Heterostelium pallidum (strain ATCC 26659 / Pp 5 / PN500) TaxID=670386 RepID=D3AYY9_HETP5|nr:enoyl-CoA hydratase/isomerase domain-containing protein [Heterostelium album PN500]EFA85679.1 enoyl-CoA hydratase/isomerase domain-containing protein [Heterostelium album PN500]|eukprot:XP_020437786.1 enoyl-CoA hydratase/isomerase domain-containing protein [Heterostelium album PN500]